MFPRSLYAAWAASWQDAGTKGESVMASPSAKIMIVEDDFLLAEELHMTISNWGYEVVGVANRGETALTMALEKQPDVLISDVRLRDAINGVTVAEEVSRRVGTQVIFLTAYPAEALVSGRSWGAKFLGKPYSETELRQVLEEAVARRAQV